MDVQYLAQENVNQTDYISPPLPTTKGMFGTHLEEMWQSKREILNIFEYRIHSLNMVQNN